MLSGGRSQGPPFFLRSDLLSFKIRLGQVNNDDPEQDHYQAPDKPEEGPRRVDPGEEGKLDADEAEYQGDNAESGEGDEAFVFGHFALAFWLETLWRAVGSVGKKLHQYIGSSVLPVLPSQNPFLLSSPLFLFPYFYANRSPSCAARFRRPPFRDAPGKKR